uniref:CHCH domain-containing protein n=1 Tax=Aegilops tauschii subsp. strangulata TaxID=200361 RepID=A0A453H3A2_AEGTS
DHLCTFVLMWTNCCSLLLQCINHYGSDISKCQFYLDMLNECRRGGAGAGATL